MSKAKVLKGKNGIRKATILYKETLNHLTDFDRDCVCPNCGYDSHIGYMDFCEGCGEIVCIECQRSDSEGTTLCEDCYQELKNS